MFDNAKQDLQRSKGAFPCVAFWLASLTSESKLRKIILHTMRAMFYPLPAFALIAPHSRFSYLSALYTFLFTFAHSYARDRFR
jgi:hypothetical protein